MHCLPVLHLQMRTVPVVESFDEPAAAAAAGWSYDCPRLRAFRADCSDEDNKPNGPCGNTACRNKDGSLMTPMPFMRAASLAAFVAADSGNATNGNNTDGDNGLSTSQVAAADPSCPIPQPSQQPLNTADDPFMQYMRKSADFTTFKYFNPVNAGQYRDAVARWCVGMMLAIDNFVMRQSQQGNGGIAINP
jgi:hypothetical protein